MPISKDIILDRGNNTSCTINLIGAKITSWRINGVDQMYLKSSATVDDEPAIRGGLPLIYPNFKGWRSRNNNIVATVQWTIEIQPVLLENGDIVASFSATDTTNSREYWDYPFKLVLKVVLKEKELETSLTIHNLDDSQEFMVTISLENCFKIDHSRELFIRGLQNYLYKDHNRPQVHKLREKEEEIAITNDMNRTYEQSLNAQTLLDKSSGRKINIVKEFMPDMTIQKPWSIHPKMSDTANEEYTWIHIQTGIFVYPISIRPSSSFAITQTLIPINFTINNNNVPLQI